MGSDSWIPLRDGPTVRESLIVWMLQAEDRGLRLTVASDDLLEIGPRRLVTDDDLAFAKAHKYDLIAALKYIDEMCRRPL
jgi:hypothetical protein